MRRVTMVAALVAALLMMTAGIALAETFRGDDGPNTITGTNDPDTIEGLAGDDFIDVQGDGRVDEVDCGSGRDVVRANPEDNLAANCEVAKSVVGPK
jgi:Ca2+-binding RTX toxin-like protein